MNTYNPRPILKRGMSTSTNSDTSYDEEFVSSTSTSTSISSSSSSSSRRSVSFVKHENGTPVSHVHLTHSPCTYDRSPIKVQQNELALPKRGARTYYEGVKPRPEEQKRTQGDDEDRGRSRGRRTSMAPQDRSRMHTEGGTGSLSRKELLRREVENTSVFYEDEEEEGLYTGQPLSLTTAFNDMSLTPVPSRCTTPRPSNQPDARQRTSHPGVLSTRKQKEKTSGDGHFNAGFGQDMGCLGGF